MKSCRSASSCFSHGHSSLRRYRTLRVPGQDSVEDPQRHEPRLGLRVDQLEKQIDLGSVVDVLRQMILGHNFKKRSDRIGSLVESRSNNFKPDWSNPLITHHPGKDFLRLRHVESTHYQQVATSLDLLRLQLKSCEAPEDLTRFFAVTARHVQGLELLATSSMQRLVLNQFKSRTQTNKEWPSHLAATTFYIDRLQAANLSPGPAILIFAVDCAVRAKNYVAVKRHLHSLAKLRPSAAKRKDSQLFEEEFAQILEALVPENDIPSASERRAILEIVWGFADADPTTPYHMRALLPRGDYTCQATLMKLTALLAPQGILQHEWYLWRKLFSTKEDSKVTTTAGGRSHKRTSNTLHPLYKIGVFHFLEAAARTKNIELFNQVFDFCFEERDGVDLIGKWPPHSHEDEMLEELILQRMATKTNLSVAARQTLYQYFIGKLEQGLKPIEDELQIRWITNADGTGYHDRIRKLKF